MKLLLFYAYSFSYETAAKSLTSVPDVKKKESIRDAAVIFFHVEAEDREKKSKVVQKFVKNGNELGAENRGGVRFVPLTGGTPEG